MDNLLSVIVRAKERFAATATSSFTLPTDEMISNCEEEIGLAIPADFKIVLKQISNLTFGSKELVSITQAKSYEFELSRVIKEAQELGVPRDWFPICENNGDYFCITSDNSIHYWSQDGTSDECWDNLAIWINDVLIDGN